MTGFFMGAIWGDIDLDDACHFILWIIGVI